MVGYLLARAGQTLAAIFLALTVVFFLVRITGDPVILFLPPDARPNDVASVRHLLGFDRPVWEQYLSFLGGAVRGDFGRSLRYRVPALPLVLHRFPATFQLAATSLAIVACVAVPIGIVSAARRGTLVDTIGIAVTSLGQAIPGFWLGLMLVWVFGVKLRWLPVAGYGDWTHFVLPSLTLTAFYAAQVARVTRSSVVDALCQDYVRTARAKGIDERGVLARHALRNAAIPIVTVFGLNAGHLLGGAVVTETIFAWPGVGQYIFNALRLRDFPVVMVGVFLTSVIYLLVNLLVDLSYAWLNPQVRYG
ncbi:MAG TPA: ABC transporter permease [bacterium]|nr:ABC transporter permease [bacterium]